MAGPKWTEAEDALLAKLLAEGRIYDYIAAELGRGRGAVAGRISRLGLKSVHAERYGYGKGKKIPKAPKSTTEELQVVTVVDFTPKPVPKEPTEPTGIKVGDLLSAHCRWPLGHPNQPDFSFCGEDKRFKSSYCEKHHAMAYAPQPKRIFKKGVRT